jgi:two-component system heavy metal sensor histidine kinase CusS
VKPLSIRLRLAVWYCAVLLFGLGLFAFGMWYILQLRLVAEVDQRLAQRVAGLHAALGTEAEIRSASHLQKEFAEFTGEVSDGTLVQMRAASGALTQSSTRQPVFAESVREGSYRTVEAGGAEYRVTATHLDTAGDHYHVLVARSLAEVRDVMRVFRYLLFLMIPPVLAVASLGGYWLSARALSPVDQITATAQSIGVQDLSRRIAVPRTGDELERMAQVWNAMLERLDISVQRIRQFTADASHELRTPLALIRTTAELALRRERSPDEYRDSLREVLAEVTRMTQLTESLLTLARSDTKDAGMAFAPVDLAGLVRSVMDECAALAGEKSIRLLAGFEPDPLTVTADPAAIRRLLLILLDNAVRHTPAGGAITVSAHSGGSVTELSVADTGPGIPPAAFPHIFERFYRADSARSGGSSFGLGLSIAQAIAAAHGTELTAANIPGAGARFRLTLRN